MEKNNITLSLGNVSLDKELGIYYIDMRPSIIHYTESIYNGGVDEDGVPFLRNKKGLVYYTPVNIAQYGLIIHANYIESKDTSLLKILTNCIKRLESIKKENELCVYWEYYEYNEKYKIKPPYTSSMAQGQVISFYLRYYQITKDDYFLKQSIKIYKFLKIEVQDGGVRRYDDECNLWFEEYPTEKPSFVLNGFIYCIFGLFDLKRIIDSQDINEDIENCIKTLEVNLHKFDAGYWSKYDLIKFELVRYYYQKNVHVPQLSVLYRLTNKEIFNHYSKKWAKNITWYNFMFVKLMYRIQPRYRKALELMNKFLHK